MTFFFLSALHSHNIALVKEPDKESSIGAPFLLVGNERHSRQGKRPLCPTPFGIPNGACPRAFAAKERHKHIHGLPLLHGYIWQRRRRTRKCGHRGGGPDVTSGREKKQPVTIAHAQRAQWCWVWHRKQSYDPAIWQLRHGTDKVCRRNAPWCRTFHWSRGQVETVAPARACAVRVPALCARATAGAQRKCVHEGYRPSRIERRRRPLPLFFLQLVHAEDISKMQGLLHTGSVDGREYFRYAPLSSPLALEDGAVRTACGQRMCMDLAGPHLSRQWGASYCTHSACAVLRRGNSLLRLRLAIARWPVCCPTVARAAASKIGASLYRQSKRHGTATRLPLCCPRHDGAHGSV